MFCWFLSNHEKWRSEQLPSAQKIVAYLRVSTLDQGIEKNKTDILRFANQHDLEKVRFVEEVASGRIPWRERRIAAVLEELQADDAIIVAELSRLGRSMLECMEILALATRKGIRVYSVKGNWQLDQSIQSKIIALAFSMAAEIERDSVSKRIGAAALAVGFRADLVGIHANLTRDIRDVHGPEFTGEEPTPSLEIACRNQKADLVGRCA
jgi:hypothetical protein